MTCSSATQKALLCFHCNNDYENAPQCYLKRTFEIITFTVLNWALLPLKVHKIAPSLLTVQFTLLARQKLLTRQLISHTARETNALTNRFSQQMFSSNITHHAHSFLQHWPTALLFTILPHISPIISPAPRATKPSLKLYYHVNVWTTICIPTFSMYVQTLQTSFVAKRSPTASIATSPRYLETRRR